MKKFLWLLPALMLLCTSALAYNSQSVVDDAGLLTAQEEAALTQRIDTLYEAYDFQVVFHTADGIGGQPIHLYAADFYDYNGYGYGSQGDGLIFVLDMDEREYVTVTTGRGINYFGDYTIAMIEENIVGYLSDGDYYAGFDGYLDQVESQLEYVNSQDKVIADTPDRAFDYVQSYDYYDARISHNSLLLISVAVAAIITVAVLAVMISGMKTARKKNEARDYMQQVNLTRVQDVFLFATERHRRIETSSGSGGRSGSTTFRGSSGRSHGGGRAGKF